MSTSVAPSSSPRLSIGVIVGIVLVACAALSLTAFLVYRCASRKCRQEADAEKCNAGQMSEKSSKKTLALSVTLPQNASLPPLPVAKQYPLVPNSPHAVLFVDDDADQTPTTPNPFKTSIEREGSISIPRSSIVGSRKSSIASLASITVGTPVEPNPVSPIDRTVMEPDIVQVCHIFRPLLPDELVIQPNEKLTLIRSFDDGWCIVGRKSPFYAPAPMSPTSAAFGKTNGSDEIEIGAVPLWVFDNHIPSDKAMTRPIRTTSMGVNVVVSDSIYENGHQ